MTGAPTTEAAFGRLHHVGVATPHLGVAAANLCQLLSGRITEEASDEDLAASMVWIESAGNPIIELVAPHRDAGPIAEFLARRGPGLHHLSFEPASLDRAIEHARCCDLPVIGENRSHGGFEEFFVHPGATAGALFHAFRALED
jgi:methylmalonyl-CoA/ethylmalonyl-CoA epimerase